MRLQVTYEFDINEDYWFGEDYDAKKWFFDSVLQDDVILFSNEIGEEISNKLCFISAKEV